MRFNSPIANGRKRSLRTHLRRQLPIKAESSTDNREPLAQHTRIGMNTRSSTWIALNRLWVGMLLVLPLIHPLSIGSQAHGQSAETGFLPANATPTNNVLPVITWIRPTNG